MNIYTIVIIVNGLDIDNSNSFCFAFHIEEWQFGAFLWGGYSPT